MRYIVFSSLENVQKQTADQLQVPHFDCKALPMGEVPMHGIAVAHLGPVVVQLMKKPKRYSSKDIGLSTCRLTVAEYAAVMAKYTSRPARDAKMLLESFEKLDFLGAHKLGNMFSFYMLGPDQDIALTLKLNPKARTFEERMADQSTAFQDF